VASFDPWRETPSTIRLAGETLYPEPVSFFNPMANPRGARRLGIIKYLAVPNGLGSCCEYLIFLRCRGSSLAKLSAAALIR
jgi:hypothetical protein